MDNTSDAEVIGLDTAQYLQNAICDKAGLLRTNIRVVDLLASDFATPIDAIGFYYRIPPAQDRALFLSNGILWECLVTPGSPVPTLAPPTAVPADPAVTFTPGVGARFVAFNDELIILQADGSQFPYRYLVDSTGSHVYLLGITPPPAPGLAAAAPGVNPGKQLNLVYRYRLTYFDSKFRESSLGSQATITLTNPALNAVSVTCPAFPDTQTTGCYVYEAVPGNNTFYRVHTFVRTDAGTNWLDDLTDNQVIINPIQWVDPNNFQAYDRPHKASVGVNYKNYLMLNDAQFPQQLQVSNLSSPTQFSPISLLPTEGGEFIIDTDQADPVMALVSYGSILKIWKQRGFYLMFGDFVSDFTIRALHQRGTVCSDSAVRCDNEVMSYSLDGVYAYNYVGGFLAQRTSQAIQASFDALAIDTTGQDKILKAHSAYVDNKYFLWIDKTIYLYDFRSQKPGWTTISLKG